MGQSHVVDAVSEQGGGTFRRQSLVPEVWHQAIPQFCLPPRIVVLRRKEPPANELCFKKASPEAKTVSRYVEPFLMVLFHYRTIPREAGPQITHDAGACVKGDLVFEKLVCQRNEHQPAGLEGALDHLPTIAARQANGQFEVGAGGQENAALLATEIAHLWPTDGTGDVRFMQT